MKKRFTLIEAGMKNNICVIEVPDSVNFTDAGGLNFLKYYFYYTIPGDVDIVLT